MMKKFSVEINWKGIGDYLTAARTILNHGTSNTVGPRIHCQGLALELALKFYLWEMDGEYPSTHNLEYFALNCCNSLKFSEKEISGITTLNSQYLKDDEFPYPCRYRPAATRVFMSISQKDLEGIISKIIQNTGRPELLDRIMDR